MLLRSSISALALLVAVVLMVAGLGIALILT